MEVAGGESRENLEMGIDLGLATFRHHVQEENVSKSGIALARRIVLGSWHSKG